MAKLQRALSRLDLTIIAIGSTVGSGIFLTPSLIARALPSPLLICTVWIVGGLMAMAGALRFEELITYVVFTDWIFFALAAASVFVFRKRRPDAERPFRTPGYPLTPLFFIIISIWFVANTFVREPRQAWAGLLFLALGVPVYYFWKKQNITI